MEWETEMKVLMTVILASFLVGCASTGAEYAKVYDRKYNETRLVSKQDPGTFVGTSAAKPALRAPGQHP